MDPTDFRGQVGLQRKRILVAIVYCRKQMEQVRTAIKRWNSAHVKPCSYISGDYGLLFIQSDPDEENFSTKEELFDFLKDNSEAVRCFSSVTFRFTSIGFDGYHAGPAQMFKEMILGDAGADFDYVFQMEPDVFPVRPMWLHALSGIADDGVWVKGSPGLYFDSSEADASFISIVGGDVDPIILGPLGYRPFHVNGNALYALSSEFRSKVRKFIHSIQTNNYTFPCQHRKNRMECDGTFCHGSFDTTLIEYLLSTERLPELFAHRYIYSSFVLNGLSGIPLSTIPPNTMFVHKPWRGDIASMFTADEFSQLRMELAQLEH